MDPCQFVDLASCVRLEEISNASLSLALKGFLASFGSCGKTSVEMAAAACYAFKVSGPGVSAVGDCLGLTEDPARCVCRHVKPGS